MTEIELTNSDEVAVIDDADYQAVSAFDWRLMNTRTGHVYVVTKNSGVNVFLHRFLMEPRHRQVVIHLNGNGLDNQRSNLFCCSMAQMRAISNKQQSKTGLRGVTNSHHGKYKAEYRASGKSIHIGYFATAQEAHEAYKSKMREVYGDLINSARWVSQEVGANA